MIGHSQYNDIESCYFWQYSRDFVQIYWWPDVMLNSWKACRVAFLVVFKLDTCLWNTDAPSCNKVKYGKNLLVLHFDPPHPQGHGMSVNREEPIDELTVQVWLLYHHPNFKYCTLLVSRTELRTDEQTDGRTDRRTIWLLDAPGGPFRPGA